MNRDFLDVLSSHGISFPPREITAGRFTRWGDDNQFWATKIVDGYVYGSWQPMFFKSTWFPLADNKISKAELKDRKRMIKEAFAEEEKIRLEEQLTAAAQAYVEYENYSSDCTASQYLKRKQIEAFGVKFCANHSYYKKPCLVIPAYDAEGKLWTLQYIFNEKFIGKGDKKRDKTFFTGGKKQGCFYTIGDIVTAMQILVFEGFATAASGHRATGVVSVVAFDAGNIDYVVAALKLKYSDAEIVVAGDNDQWKDVNAGRITAEEAHKNHGVRFVLPMFALELIEKMKTAEEKLPTDFNDLHVLQGLDEVKKQLSCIISDVTSVTDVQANDSGADDVTEAITDAFDDVTEDFVSLIPAADERPCYIVFDDWYEEGKSKFRAGVWYFYIAAGKGGQPDILAQKWICTPLHVYAVTFDGQENNFGRLLRFKNTLKNPRTWSMPMELLKGNGDEMRGILMSMGVEIDPKARVEFSNYLQSQHPKKRVRCALQVGWCEDSFVLPDRVIGNKAFDIIFQSGESADNEYTCAGTVEGWKTEIAAYAIGNPMLTTALSCAFAGALLEPCNAESGGLHFRGHSSTGKTGLIEAACSVWGGKNYKRSWRATANGMEGVSTMFNDGLLALDEISECDPKEVGAIVYALGNGIGKQRASRSGNAKTVKRWRCFVLSSGERTIETTMAEAGHRAKAGQLVRLPSVPIERKHGVWDELHGMTGEGLTNHIKDAAKLQHGHVGRAFLERLTRDERDFRVVLERIKALPEFTLANSEGQAKRVAGRFALIAMAGELATEYGLTGWAEYAAISASAIALAAWQSTQHSGGNNEKRQYLEAVSSFIERHGDSRFSEANDTSADSKVYDRAGWWRDTDSGRVYLFNKEGMHEVLKSFDFKAALDELQRAGVIPASNSNGERSKPIWIGKRQVRLYEIHADKLGGGYES